MREIKFRTWEPDKKRMTYLENEYVSEALHYNERGTHILQQYTGVKDPNDKEIYEGDIVSLYGREIARIQWARAYSGFQWCTVDKNGEPTDYYGGLGTGMGDISVWEVIGNIYENPELIHPNTNVQN